LHEKRHGEFPAKLSDLAALGVDLTQYMPPGKQPFGYAVEEQRAVLWGADFNQGAVIPAEPPTVDPSEANAWVDVLWTWRLLKQATEAPSAPGPP
jgi:hypothetical protein